MSESDPVPRRSRKKLTIKEAAQPAPELSFETPEVHELEPAPTAIVNPVRTERPADRDPNIKLQLGFFVAVVSGVIAAASGYVQSLQWLGFAGPLLAITGFYIFGLVQGFAKRSDTRQQFADSCYFLGFLLTMVAMLIGFLPAGMLGEEITSQGILRHFSMALGATALGLVFRILALQGGRSIGQIAAEVETTLTQYARKVSVEARAISQELNALQVEIAAQREHVASIVTSDLKDSVQAAFGPINQSVSAIAASLEQQSSQIAKSAVSVQRALNASAQQLTAAADIKVDADEAAQKAATSVAESLNQFEGRMTELREQIGKAVFSSTDQLERMTRAFEKGAAVAPALGQTLDGISTDVNSLSLRIGDVQDQSDRLAERLNDSFGDGNKLLSGVDEIQASISQAGREARESIAREGEETRRALASTREEVSRALETERQLVAQRLNDEIAVTTDRLAQVLGEFASKIEAIRGGVTR